MSKISRQTEKSTADLILDQERLSIAKEAASLGIFDDDLASGIFTWDNRVREIWGVEPDEPVTPETFISCLHPDDRVPVQSAVDRVLDPAGDGRYYAEFRVTGRKGGVERWVAATGRVFFDQGRAVRFVGTTQDITERRQAEANQALLTEVLHILNRGRGLETAVREILDSIQRATEFDAVGLRLRKGDNYPYFEQNGLKEEFLEYENFLCALDGTGAIIRDAVGRAHLECTCGLVLSGRTDSSMSCFTATGSFWTNRSTDLLALPQQDDPRTNPRNRCINSGYQSVGLFPVRTGQEIIGLLQLNGRREGMFTPERLVFYESLAQNIGLGIQHAIAEKALRDSESRYRAYFHLPMAGIGVTTPNQGWIDVNPALCAMLGYEREELICRTWSELTHPEDVENNLVQYRRVLAGEIDGYSLEKRFIRKDQSILWVDLSVHCVRSGSGDVSYFIALIKDISDRKRAEEALLLTQASVDGAAEMVAWFTSSGRVLYVNETLCRALGYSREELMNMNCLDFTPGLTRWQYQAYWLEVRRQKSLTLETTHRRKDGTEYPVEVLVSHVVYDDREFIYAYGRDITERKKAEQDLQRLNSDLERLVEERTAEASSLATQLRELAAELTLTEQRERQRIAKVLHDHIQQILVAAKLQNSTVINRQQNDAVKASARLVSDLIDQTIAVSRNLTAELTPPVLYDAGLGPALLWLSRNLLDKHGLEVEVTFDPSGEPRVEDLRIFLFDAIREILFNVIKHSGVQRADIKCLRGRDDRVHVVISDQGKGFDPSRLQTGERSEGFGLFSIQQRLRHLGGRLEIDSVPGQGTRITILTPPFSAVKPLPLSTIEKTSRVTPTGTLNDGKIRVVLADDHHIIRQGLAGLLRVEPDIEIVGEAANGAQAINLARSLQPDVVVMDVSMPVLNGIEATAEIHRDFPNIQVIGLSMHEEGELSSAIRQAGAVAYVTKGGPPEALVAAIRKAVGNKIF